MPRAPKPVLTFICDTREKLVFHFAAPVRREFADGGTIVKGLGLGGADYSCSLDGGETILPVRVERKSLIDLMGCVGNGRDRFERELDALRKYDYRAIVVEATLDDILRGHERSQVSGRAAATSLMGWSVRFECQVWLAENHRRAAGVCQRLLEEFAVEHLRKQNAA